MATTKNIKKLKKDKSGNNKDCNYPDYKFGQKMPRVKFLSEESGVLKMSRKDWESDDVFDKLEKNLKKKLKDKSAIPLRFAFAHSHSTEQTLSSLPFEVGVLHHADKIKKALKNKERRKAVDEISVFNFRKRELANQEKFNVAFVLPTGTGCELGGHAGDAGPTAKLLGGCCDRLVTHPNAVNASDLNEMPENALYVEGSVLAQVMMGSVGLAPVLSNRVLAVIHDRKLDEKTAEDALAAEIYANCAVNMVNGGRASAGYRTDEITMINGMAMEATLADSQRATGKIFDFDRLCKVLEPYIDSQRASAVAVTTKIDLPRGEGFDFHDDYFLCPDSMANPYGGVEAILTHAISSIFNIPAAHSPMFEDIETMNEDPFYMDPRTGVEGCAVTFLHCLLKGLHKSPALVRDPGAMQNPSVLTAEDISCLVIPEGCLGLPTLAALKQGMTVIAVRDRTCLMKNPLADLPWAPDQYCLVDNYLEAAGVLTALRNGISLASVQRPLASALVNGKLPKLDLREEAHCS